MQVTEAKHDMWFKDGTGEAGCNGCGFYDCNVDGDHAWAVAAHDKHAVQVRPEYVVWASPNVGEAVERWINRGDLVAVFENKALDSANCGHHVFLPLTVAEAQRVVVGKTAAPDGAHGLGWKYLLTYLTAHREDFDVRDTEWPRQVRVKAS